MSRITLSERVAIEAGLYGRQSLKEIAEKIQKSPRHVSAELKRNSTKITAFDASCPDPMTAKLSWKVADRAIGYNIRYGISPDKLYSSHMVYGQTEVLLTMLNAGQNYYAAVDSFGEGGVTEGECLPLQ